MRETDGVTEAGIGSHTYVRFNGSDSQTWRFAFLMLFMSIAYCLSADKRLCDRSLTELYE
jgi:hypothetical protein